MDIYVLPDYKAKEFVAFCEVLQIKKNTTVEKMLESGFTNFYKPHLYFSRRLKQPDNYNVSFGIIVSKKTKKILSFEILDENFCQPCFCTDNDLKQVKNIVDELIKKGILERSEGLC